MKLNPRMALAGALVMAALGAMAGGWWVRRSGNAANSSLASSADAQRKVLYWYDPMVPAQHFDRPGKSPFMDMQLVARFANEASGETPGIRIDPRLAQNLGVRLATVERRDVAQSIEVPGTVIFNGRDAAILQARTAGFVTRIYPHAPGDVVTRDAPLADLLTPDWVAAQTEFLALMESGDAPLLAAARQRLLLLGMPSALIAQIEQSRQVRAEFTVSSPIAGMIDTLDVRSGMTVSAGNTLATIKGIDPIWIEAAVPEAAGTLSVLETSASVQSAARAEHAIEGRVIAVLPQTNSDTHTLRIRIALPNHDGQWKPGMFAQVRLTGRARQEALLVPSEAIIHTGTRNLVVIAGGDHHFESVEVRIGPQYGDRTQVIAGLQEGQQVVASGQFLIDSEASLRGASARMSPSAQESGQESGASDPRGAKP
jgi:membrane fusion protein, copper/silver efflux system